MHCDISDCDISVIASVKFLANNSVVIGSVIETHQVEQYWTFTSVHEPRVQDAGDILMERQDDVWPSHFPFVPLEVVFDGNLLDWQNIALSSVGYCLMGFKKCCILVKERQDYVWPSISSLYLLNRRPATGLRSLTANGMLTLRHNSIFFLQCAFLYRSLTANYDEVQHEGFFSF